MPAASGDILKQVAGSLRAHPWWSVAGVCVVLVAGAAFFARDLIGLALTADEPIDYTLPKVLPLQAGPGETIYRIDANRSTVTVSINEVLAGVDNEVHLSTQGVAGDFGVTGNDASTARLSEIAVSVHQLESDNALRDKMLQHQYLESHDHQTVNLVDAEVVDHEQAPGSAEAEFAIEGDLIVKTERHPVRFEGTATVTDGTLTAEVTGQLKMSELGVGPITKVGLVQTSDDIEVTLDLVANSGLLMQGRKGLIMGIWWPSTGRTSPHPPGFHWPASMPEPGTRRHRPSPVRSSRSWRRTASRATAPERWVPRW